VFFALLGAAIVFIRTRYAVAVYLVTFGSIIVAAYKLGMVHERSPGGKPSTLKDATEGDATSEVVNSGSAFEITAGGPGIAGASAAAPSGGTQARETNGVRHTDGTNPLRIPPAA